MSAAQYPYGEFWLNIWIQNKKLLAKKTILKQQIYILQRTQFTRKGKVCVIFF